MKNIGFFSEMNIGYCNSGSVKNYIIDSVDYDKEEVIKYLKSAKRIAGCPREAIDCFTRRIFKKVSQSISGEPC
jgi:hypothetical protein